MVPGEGLGNGTALRFEPYYKQHASPMGQPFVVSDAGLAGVAFFGTPLRFEPREKLDTLWPVRVSWIEHCAEGPE